MSKREHQTRDPFEQTDRLRPSDETHPSDFQKIEATSQVNAVADPVTQPNVDATTLLDDQPADHQAFGDLDASVAQPQGVTLPGLGKVDQVAGEGIFLETWINDVRDPALGQRGSGVLDASSPKITDASSPKITDDATVGTALCTNETFEDLVSEALAGSAEPTLDTDGLSGGPGAGSHIVDSIEHDIVDG